MTNFTSSTNQKIKKPSSLTLNLENLANVTLENLATTLNPLIPKPILDPVTKGH